MAWTRQLADGTFKGAYRDAYGKRKTVDGTYVQERHAKRAAEAKEEEARRLKHKDTPITWGQWSEQWMEHRDVAESTRLTDEQRINSHVLPRWGKTALSDIKRADVKRWMTELKKNHKPNTVNRIVGLLNTSLKEAVDQELISVNPAQGVRLSVGEATYERFLTKAELDKVCAHLSPEWARLARFLAYTGLRWGEAVGLQSKRIDRERGMILVAEVWDDKAGEMKPYPKGKRRRSVPVPGWVMDGLKDADPVLPSPRGKRPAIRNFRRALDDAADAARIERFRVHDLRHTYSSWLVQAGVPLEEVRKLLGHTSVQTTQRYAHLADTPTDSILGALR